MCDKTICSCRKKLPYGASKDEPWLRELKGAYERFAKTESSSLLKKHLTRSIFDTVKRRRTSNGATLIDLVQSGFENPDSNVGIYAPDAESYKTFAELFDPIIEEYHAGFASTDAHPPTNWGDHLELGNLDPDGAYVVSTRVRCARSIRGYPFNPIMSEDQYREIENKVRAVLTELGGDLAGSYYSLKDLDAATRQRLVDDHFLFKEGDRFLEAAKSNRFWPEGRGIFHNGDKTFLVWCNEEDHLRLISMDKGADLGGVYERFARAVELVANAIPFAVDERFGNLTFCPSNLGTAIRASVHIKLPLLSSDYDKFEETAGRFGLQVRGTRGEHTKSEGGVYDVSNKRRLGINEITIMREMRDGISKLISLEKELENTDDAN